MAEAAINDAIGLLAEQLRNRLELGPMRHIKIQKYTPSQDIRIWLTAFDQRCEVDGIDVGHRKSELLSNLDLATAFAAVQRLNLPEDLTYQEFKERLVERFGRLGSSAEFREEFRSRMQGRNEQTDSFADALIELSSRAFPNMNAEQKEEEVVEQFIKGARIPTETREKLIFAQPANLQEARRMLRRIEAAWQMSHKGGLRVTREDEEAQSIIAKQKAEIAEQRKMIEELKEAKQKAECRGSEQYVHRQNQPQPQYQPRYQPQPQYQPRVQPRPLMQPYRPQYQHQQGPRPQYHQPHREYRQAPPMKVSNEPSIHRRHPGN